MCMLAATLSWTVKVLPHSFLFTAICDKLRALVTRIQWSWEMFIDKCKIGLCMHSLLLCTHICLLWQISSGRVLINHQCFTCGCHSLLFFLQERNCFRFSPGMVKALAPAWTKNSKIELARWEMHANRKRRKVKTGVKSTSSLRKP